MTCEDYSNEVQHVHLFSPRDNRALSLRIFIFLTLVKREERGGERGREGEENIAKLSNMFSNCDK